MPKTTTRRSRAARWRAYPVPDDAQDGGGGPELRGGVLRKKTAKGYRYVSHKRSINGKANPWIQAVQEARKELDLKGFHPLTKDSEFYKTARKIYDSR